MAHDRAICTAHRVLRGLRLSRAWATLAGLLALFRPTSPAAPFDPLPMQSHSLSVVGAAFVAVSALLPALLVAQAPPNRGDRVPASAVSPLVEETMDIVLAREALAPPDATTHGLWNGQDGRWIVPPDTAKTPAHSGSIAIVNEWGDPRMGIGFGRLVDLDEVWLAGHGSTAAPSVRLVGFRAGIEVIGTEWTGLGGVPQRFALGFAGIDRFEVQVIGSFGPAGFIALDDLRFCPHGQPTAAILLDFEDLSYRTKLSGSRYAGLDWEIGRGFRLPISGVRAVQGPLTEADDKGAVGLLEPPSGTSAATTLPTTPTVWTDFVGASQGDPGAGYIPPDSCGAVGPDHYVTVVNTNLSAFTKTTGARVLNVTLSSFWGSTGVTGDPRAVFDPHSGRFVLLATNFSSGRTIYVAVSATDDPTGAWFKFSFRVDQGSDAGRWPDYPTLGVDARGIYMAAYMVGSPSRMTIWAIDKAPLVAASPSLGTITAFRSLPFEQAIQPCTTYGDPGAEYFVSRRSGTQFRLRRVTPPLTAPTLIEAGSITVTGNSSPPNAPALGSTTNLNTIDTRPMNAVYRNGSVYTVHGIGVGSKSAIRWYQFGTTPIALLQTGTIVDALWYYYYGSIAVDALGNIGIAFSGSHAGAYPGVFVTGRTPSDPVGTTAAPMLAHAGEGSINHLDSGGRNRFGDYSHINVDPVDDLGFWTIQEYGGASNLWRTRIARFGFEAINYGTGLAGANGVPSLSAGTRPVIGQNLRIVIGNSSGIGGAGCVLVAGVARANLPVLGGTLLVAPIVTQGLALGPLFSIFNILYPNDPSLVGQPVDFQTVQLDTAAPQSFAFSCGLEVRPGSQ